MSFPRYPEYKDSGVEWLGEVPAHWCTAPLKALANGPNGLFIDGDWIESKDISATGIRYITTGNVGEGEYREQGEGFITEETFASLNCTEVLPGDVLISRLNAPIARACIVPDLGCRIVTSVDNVIFRPSAEHSRRFLVYLMSSPEHFANTEILARGSTMQRISRSILGNIRFCIPGCDEQSAIARFLDRETAKIDALVAEQQKLIALLQEKRQAAISHAVTKGLNPAAPMKDSGIEWLGEVPAHWRVGKIQTFAQRESGHTPSRQHPEYWENCNTPWFSLADVWQLRTGNVKRVYETKEMVSELGLANSSARLLPAGTVMLSRTASVGYSAIMGRDMATTQDFINWVCKPYLSPEFLLYVLRGMKSEFDRLMMGSTHQTIYMPDVAKLIMGLPPLGEQEGVVSFLDCETARLDELIAEAARAAALLQERRSALISAAVTGKIDVRGLVAEKEAA